MAKSLIESSQAYMLRQMTIEGESARRRICGAQATHVQHTLTCINVTRDDATAALDRLGEGDICFDAKERKAIAMTLDRCLPGASGSKSAVIGAAAARQHHGSLESWLPMSL